MIKLVDILNEIALDKESLIQQAKDLLSPKEDPEIIDRLFNDSSFEEVAAMLSDRRNLYGDNFARQIDKLLTQMGYPEGYVENN